MLLSHRAVGKYDSALFFRTSILTQLEPLQGSLGNSNSLLPLMPEVDLLGFLSPREVIVVQWSLVLSTLALWKPAGHSLVFISSNSLWGLGLRSAWPTVPGELEQGAGKSNGWGAILPHLVFL